MRLVNLALSLKSTQMTISPNSPQSWDSLLRYLSARLARFLLFIQHNEQSLEPNQRYLDLFFADLVRSLRPFPSFVHLTLLP